MVMGKKDLLLELESLERRIDDLKLDVYDMEEVKPFEEEYGEQLLNSFKSYLIRSNLWNDKLQEELDLFIKFYLKDVIETIID